MMASSLFAPRPVSLPSDQTGSPAALPEEGSPPIRWHVIPLAALAVLHLGLWIAAYGVPRELFFWFEVRIHLQTAAVPTGVVLVTLLAAELPWLWRMAAAFVALAAIATGIHFAVSWVDAPTAAVMVAVLYLELNAALLVAHRTLGWRHGWERDKTAGQEGDPQPGPQTQFQIWQLLVLTAIVAVLLAVLRLIMPENNRFLSLEGFMWGTLSLAWMLLPFTLFGASLAMTLLLRDPLAAWSWTACVLLLLVPIVIVLQHAVAGYVANFDLVLIDLASLGSTFVSLLLLRAAGMKFQVEPRP